MAGHFINTERTDTINSIIDGMNNLLKHPYYSFQDEKATPADYYNININKSTIDQGSKNTYADIGPDCPLKFNLIKDFYLYGLSQIQIQLESGEYGLTSSDITGEVTILPNTITPYPGDYFIIKYLKRRYLFKVINVSIDTLEDGANIWKLEYALDQLNEVNIDCLVSDKFRFISTNAGTNFKCIIREEKYTFAELLDKVSIAAKDYFIALYMNDNVQTFTFKLPPEEYMYDPILIEFLIRNKVLSGSSQYVYVTHQLNLPRSFSIDYGKSIFSAFEQKDLDILDLAPERATGVLIDTNVNITSIFAYSYYRYYCMKHNNLKDIHLINPIDIINYDIKLHIKDHKYYYEPENIYKNILIRYFYDEDLNTDEIHSLERINYNECGNELFYLLPLLIYIIDNYIKNLFV